MKNRKRLLPKRLWTDRVPEFLPQPWRRRIEVNMIYLEDLMQQAQQLIQPHETVLDAGAGEGRFRHYLDHAQYIAVDIGVGDEGWDYTKLDVEGDLLHLPFPTNSIDNVVCTQVLEHVRNPPQVIREFARVLKPGGRLFLAAPQAWYQHQKPHDFFRFTSFALDMMFRDAGLTPEFIRPMGGFFWYLSYQLQTMHYWLPGMGLYRKRTWWGRILSLILRVIFLFLLPIPLYYLDRLDQTCDATLGYICLCTKPPQQES